MEQKQLLVVGIVMCLLIGGVWLLYNENKDKQPPLKPEPKVDWNKTVLGPDIEILVSKEEAEKRAIEVVKKIEGVEPEIEYSELKEEHLRPVWDVTTFKNNDRGTVAIDANNGELAMYMTIEDPKPSETFPSYEDALEIADDFFKRAGIKLPENAELWKTGISGDKREMHMIWGREINGIPTRDTIHVDITSDGKVYSYSKSPWEPVEPQEPLITEEEAVQKAREQLTRHLRDDARVLWNDLWYVNPNHVWENNMTIKLDRNIRLCYVILFKNGNTLLQAEVDAQTGKVVGGGKT